MWAQLITMRLKPGKDDDELVAVMDLLRSAEQPGSGLLRSTTMRSKSPTDKLGEFRSIQKASTRAKFISTRRPTCLRAKS